jgi:hypothetical protein
VGSEGWRRYPVALGRNGKVRPGYAVFNGEAMPFPKSAWPGLEQDHRLFHLARVGLPRGYYSFALGKPQPRKRFSMK